jgi:L-fuculose-phosphate aldolase
MIDEATLRSFQRVGKELCMRGLNTSHSGNISMRTGGRVIIKKRAAMLYWLEAEDLISVSLDCDDSACLLASTELDVHREIYKNTDAMAVIHAHAPYTTVLSMIEDEITAIDAEGIFTIKKIPVIEVDIPAGASQAAEAVPPVLKNYPVCVIRSHGIFAKGNTLEDALQNVTGAEQISYIRYLTMMTGKPLKRDYSQEKSFSDW